MTKTRVYEVARELGLENRELLGKLASLGIQVRNHMSSIDPADADRVKRALDKEKQQNVVEERIRPTVVRRRVRRKPDGEAAPEVKAEQPAPEAPQGLAAVATPTPSPVPVAAPPPSEPEPSPPPPPTPPPARPAPAPTPVPQVAAAATPQITEPVERAPAPAVEPAMAARSSGGEQPLPFHERVRNSDLPPGVVARGKQIAPSARPLSEAARSRIVSEHAQRVGQQQQAPAPRRRELARSAIGPTGRQQQRGRPGRARKMAPGKKAQKTEITVPSAAKRVIRIEDQVGLQVLAGRMSLKATDVLMKLMQLGMTGVNINSTLDVDTAKILASTTRKAAKPVRRS
jgi:hypothetical protein